MTGWEDQIHGTGTGNYQLGKSNPFWLMAGRNRGRVELTFEKANSSAIISQFQGEKLCVKPWDPPVRKKEKILQKVKRHFQYERHYSNYTPEFFFFRSDFIYLFYYYYFLGPHLPHMEVPRLGVKSELWLLACAKDIATQDLSRVCNLHHSSQQNQILNPRSKARDWTRVLMDPSQVCYCWVTTGTPEVTLKKMKSFSICNEWSVILIWQIRIGRRRVLFLIKEAFRSVYHDCVRLGSIICPHLLALLHISPLEFGALGLRQHGEGL